MKPVHEISEAICKSAVGVVFDVDDTVTRHGKLELVAYEAMWQLANAGLKIAAVTGRPLGWCEVWASQWPVDFVVAENGACWTWRELSALGVSYFDPRCGEKKFHEQLTQISLRIQRAMPDVRVTSDHWARRCEVAFDVGEEQKMTEERIDELVKQIHAEGARSVVSSVHAHVILGEWDKAQGIVRAVRERLSLDVEAHREKWIFVGDSGNDAAAFSYFPETVGVANVREHLGRLPIPPRYVTGASHGAGFAECVSVLLRKRDA